MKKASKRKDLKKYNKFVQEIQLFDIHMESGKFKLKDEFKDKNCMIDYKGDVLNWEKIKKNEYIFRYKSSLKIRQRNKIIFETDCIYLLYFKTKSAFSNEYFKIFVKESNHLETFVWPYIRQWFAEITERVGLPRITAPLVKSFLTNPFPK